MTNGPVAASEVEPEAILDEEKPLTEKERLRLLHEFKTGTKPTDAVTVPTRLLKHAKKNPRKGAVAEAIESLKEFGQHRPLVVQWSNGEIIVGNHVMKAAKALGWKEIDVLIVKDDDDKAMRRALADNFVGDKAKWDEEELGSILEEIGAVPGFSEQDVAALLAKLAPPVKVDEPTYPLVPRLNERYDYVMIFCENETDWNWLQTKLQLRREKSYKSEAVATSHVITVARLQEVLDA
jgi:hypothetical protein